MALALWASGFIIASVATTLIIVLRGEVPNIWSIVLGNELLAAAYGILWCGARKSMTRTFQSRWHWSAFCSG